MGVTFLGHVVAWDGESDLLQFGLATALMTAVLTLFLWVAKGARAKALQAKDQGAAAGSGGLIPVGIRPLATAGPRAVIALRAVETPWTARAQCESGGRCAPGWVYKGPAPPGQPSSSRGKLWPGRCRKKHQIKT